MGRTGKSTKRRGPKAAPPLRMKPMASLVDLGSNPNACVMCGAMHQDKFNSTLMCATGHATCFACVAAEVRPHECCGLACNGFKYRCGGCDTWLCINKTQELALMCGGHTRARERLQEERMEAHTFDAPKSYCYYCEVEDGDTHSSSSSSASDDSVGEDVGCCPCAYSYATGATGDVQLPRVCHVDWTKGNEQRACRLARLRASLLAP